MKQSKFSVEQIIKILKENEAGRNHQKQTCFSLKNYHSEKIEKALH